MKNVILIQHTAKQQQKNVALTISAKHLFILFLLIFGLAMNSSSQNTIYSDDFNSGDEGWTGSSGWVRDNSSFSGSDGNHWHITPYNNYNNNMNETITSGSIDLSNYGYLTLDIDIRYKTENRWDGFNIEYSADDGSTWNILGAAGEGTNWYNDTDVDAIGNNVHGWLNNNGAWQTATISLPSTLEDNSTVKFRVIFASDGSQKDDGVAFDNFIIKGYYVSNAVSHNFNSGDDGWTSSAGWVNDNAADGVFTGSDGNYWHTDPFNNYNSNMDVYVSSGVIDLSSKSNLLLQVDLRYDTDRDIDDGLNMEYSDDGGSTWNILGAVGDGTNWYNDADVDGIGNQVDGWTDNNSSWQSASIELPAVLENNSNVKFRFHFASDGNRTDDGVAFDNFKITEFSTTPPVPPKTWYSYSTSGNWNDAGSWTLDAAVNPTYVNPGAEIPAATDYVVIQSGKKITVQSSTNSLSVLKLEVYGQLDLTSSHSHNFNVINGNGTILMQGYDAGSGVEDNFPDGTATLFTDAEVGGTVEIYGTGISLNQERTFNNLKINLTSGSAVLLANYILNGDLTVENSNFKINNNSGDASPNTTPLNLMVGGNVNVQSSGTITVGTANAVDGTADNGYGNYHKYYHRFTVSGNFTNQGSVRLTNETAPDYNTRSASGAVSLVFDGATNNIFNCEGTTDLYYLVIDKGTNQTYSLTINATDTSYFSLFGDNNADWDVTDIENPENRKALWIKAGSLILEGYINLPTLTEGTRDYTIGGNAAFILNGDNVFVSITTLSTDVGIHNAISYSGLSYSSATGINNTVDLQGTYINGSLIVNKGTLLSSYSHGLVYRGESPANTLEINGGIVKTTQFRISGDASVSTAKMSYIQTGGELYLIENQTNAAIFDLSAQLGSFIMTGGIMNINDLSGGTENAIEIACPTNNINVSGGTIIIDNGTGTSATATISTTAPFHNFILRNNQSNGVQLLSSLAINNDLLLEAEDLNANGMDLYIGSDLNISAGATYTTGLNTTTFNGAKKSNLYLAALQTFNNLTIAKTVEDKDFVIVTGLSTAIKVTNEFRLENGIFDYGTYTVELNGDLYVADSIGNASSTGNIYLNGTGVQTLSSSNGYIQNMEINNANGINLNGDLNITGTLTLSNGVFDINTYKLTLFGANAAFAGTFSTSNMIQSNGNSSDGGIEMYLNENEILTFPIGTDANGVPRYTPAVATFTNVSDSGYVQIRPSDEILKTTNSAGSDILSYYWRVSIDSFTVGEEPTVQYLFTYDATDDDSGNDDLFKPGKVLDEGLYTRSFEDDLTKVNDGGSPLTITFNGSGSGFTLENANYTAGENDRFTGTIEIYYTRDNTQNANWTDGNSWTRNDLLLPAYENHDSRQPAAGDYPKVGDIAVIGWVPWGNTTSNGDEGEPHILWIYNSSQECAELIFEPMLDNSGNRTARVYRTNFGFRPTLCMDGNSPELTTGLVRGEGLFWNRQSDPDFSLMDMGEYAKEDSSYILYENFVNPRTFTNTPDELPNLMVANNGWGDNDHDITFTKNILTNGNLELMGDVNILLSNGATGDITVGRNIVMFEETANNSGGGAEIKYQKDGTPRTVTVYGDINLLSTDSRSTNGGMIHVESPNAPVIEHSLICYGNINQVTGNSSTSGLQFWTDASKDVINLYLKGESNKGYNRTSGTIPNLNRVVLDKGEDQTYSFQFNTDFNLEGSTNGSTKALELINGTLILNNSDISINLSTGGDDFLIPSTTNLTITQGTAKVNGTSTGITLDGTLKINGGTLDMTDAGSNDNYIQYGSAGEAKIDISSGTLNVGTQIRRLTTNATGVLNYTQTGGTVTIGVNTDDADYEETRGMLEVLNTGSNFTLTGGTLTFVKQNGATPATAALLLDPDTYDVSGSTFTIGNDNTPENQSNFGINSSVPLNNLEVYARAGLTNYPIVQIESRSLSLLGDLTINSNATLDGNGLDLTIGGDLINNGTYTANGNTLIFDSNSAQAYSGTGTEDIYNFTKTGTGTLTMAKDFTVNNMLDIDAGTVNTDSYSLTALANVMVDGIIASTSGNGLVFAGSSTQNLERSGVGTSLLGVVTINNSNGVKLTSTGHWFNISTKLRLQSGVFNIGGSLLELGEDAAIEEVETFSTSNMIQTNSSFQDNGVKKYFAANYGLGTGNDDFIFPVGQLKYTPVTFDFTTNDTYETGSNAGSITVRPANEFHPTVNDDHDSLPSGDINNVLQYYWILRSNNMVGFNTTAKFKYENTDVLNAEGGIESDYISARIRANNNPTELIDKDFGTMNAVDHSVTFTFSAVPDNEIAGDYFAGITKAIPDNVATYTTTGTGGNITNNATFSEGLPNPGFAPTGAILVISTGDTVNFNVDDVNLYKTIINTGAVLSINETERHRLGTVTGTGDLKIISNSDDVSFPAGDYIDFFSCSGGGLDYAGTGSYSVMASLPTVRNLTISGAGTKTLANNDIVVCEDFTLEGPTFENASDRDLTVNGDMYISSGAFNSGTSNAIQVDGTVTVNGGTYNGETGGNDSFSTLTVSSGIFNIGSGGSISVANDLTYSGGTFNGGSGTSALILNGTVNQNIDGTFTGGAQLHNIEIDNSAGVTLLGNVTINNSLTLTDGLITPGSKALLLNSSATISPEIGSSSSYINGKLSKILASVGDDFVFPVGKSGRWGYAGVYNVSNAPLTWDVEYFATTPTTEGSVNNITPTDPIAIKAVSQKEYWKITDNGSCDAIIKLSWNSSSNLSADQTEREKLEVMVWNGTTWDEYGGNIFSSGHTQSNGSFLSTNFVSFSEKIITLGTADENNPLPIELISFTAKANANDVELNWATATETNNDYFEIQRSENGSNFETIKTVSGAGNSFIRIDYKEFDYNPIYGISYYRIKQVDYDGKYSYTPTISVLWNSSQESSNNDLKVYPNPYRDGKLTLDTDNFGPGLPINISIFDISGNGIYNVSLVNPENQKINLIPMAINKISKGIYIISVISGNQMSKTKLIVQ